MQKVTGALFSLKEATASLKEATALYEENTCVVMVEACPVRGNKTVWTLRSMPPKGLDIASTPKADNTSDGHCPQKRLFVGGILFLALKLFVRFGSEDLTALSSRQRGRHTYALCAFATFIPHRLEKRPPYALTYIID